MVSCWVYTLLVCGLLVFAMRANSQPLTIYTLAGHPAGGSADGPVRTSRFSLPHGIAADSSGNLYVADSQNHTIRKITPDGLVTTLAGVAGNFGSSDDAGINARFHTPQGIAVDGAGFVYVADTVNSTIRKISPAGMVSTLAGSPGVHNNFDGLGTNANFHHPQALTVDSGGTLYVADTWNHTIRRITPGGQVTTMAGLARSAGSANGTGSKARFNQPMGICIDPATNIFIADFLNHTIRKMTPSGEVTTIAGLAGVWGSNDGTNSAARFYHPRGIVAHSGNLLVVDSGNQMLRKISFLETNWVISTVAGLAASAGNLDHQGLAARFYFPAAMAIDGAGHLYVADSANNTIRTDQVILPVLDYSLVGDELVVSWPASAGGFALETADSLSLNAQWVPVNGPAYWRDYSLLVTNEASSGSAFYRLRRP